MSEKTYTINEIIDMIKNAAIAIPIERFFDITGNHITKKEYGHVLLDVLCEELREKHERIINSKRRDGKWK